MDRDAVRVVTKLSPLTTIIFPVLPERGYAAYHLCATPVTVFTKLRGGRSNVPRASEGLTHWYDRLGNAVYEVPYASGEGMRSATLADARKLGLVPGYTAVEGMLAKPALTQWLIRQGILAALTLPRVEGETEEAYLARIDQDRQAHARSRAEEGTQIHKAVEQCIRGEAYDPKYTVHADAVRALLLSLSPLDDWTMERTFAHPLGYGGRVDACSTTHIVDFKTKETLEGKTERDLFYDEHIRQLAAYEHGIMRKDIRTPVSVMIAADTGAIMHKVWTEEERKRGLAMFLHALSLWKLKQRYESGWTP